MYGVPTFGVEEEFLIVDPTTFAPAHVEAQVASALVEPYRAREHQEFYSCTLEMVTSVCTTAEALRDEISSSRIAAGQAAVQEGYRLLAVGVPPVAGSAEMTTGVKRYNQIRERFGGSLSLYRPVFGQHTHVGVSSKELAILVCTHLRPWLPTIHALSCNSKFTEGHDSGYESWRMVMMGLWPSSRPPLFMKGLDDYQDYVEKSIASGIMLNPNMVYWHARPSNRYPTVEVRVGDLCLLVEDSVVIAVLVRALVESIVRDIADGVEPFNVPDFFLNAAHWRAARFGMTGELVNLVSGQLIRAIDATEALFYKVAPVLSELGDYDLAREGLERIYDRGTGSQMQFKAYSSGGLQAVLDMLVVGQ